MHGFPQRANGLQREKTGELTLPEQISCMKSFVFPVSADGFEDDTQRNMETLE